MSNYLLTGEKGFLGHILYSYFKQVSFHVKTLSDACLSDGRVDIVNSFELMNDINIDVVVHVAGKAHMVPKTKIEETAFFDVNYRGTQNLCSALERLTVKPKSFVFISTVSVYGADRGDLITEEYPLNGNTPYAKSKIMAEQFLIEWARRNGIVLSILRLPLIAGPKPPGNLGAMINGIRSGKYLSIGNANARKSIVWALDIACLIPGLVKKGGIYNLTDGHHPSFGELENEISKSFGKSSVKKIPLFVAMIISRIGDLLGAKAPINTNKLDKITSTLTFDDNKARRELNWNPTKVLNKISEII